jgi:hypothetical protein
MTKQPLTSEARDALVRSAKRRIAPADAEDAVHNALIVALRKQAEDPASYAGGVLKNLARRSARKVPRIPKLEQPGIETVLATAENVARLDAALELVLSWGGLFGTMGLVVASLSDFDVLRVLVEFQAVLEAIDLLPFSARHRRRLRRRFEKLIAAAWKACKVSVDSDIANRRELAEEETTEDDEDEDAADDVPSSGETVQVLYFENGALERAFHVIHRAAPRLSTEDAIELAGEAVRRAVDHVTREAC